MGQAPGQKCYQKERDGVTVKTNYYVCLVQRNGLDSPLAAILWDTSLLDMMFKVWQEKNIKVIKLKNLEKGA